MASSRQIARLELVAAFAFGALLSWFLWSNLGDAHPAAVRNQYLAGEITLEEARAEVGDVADTWVKFKHRDSGTTSQPVVLTSSKVLDPHVGLLVTLRGKVTETKIATILGVDVSSVDPDLRGRLAEATGYLQRDVVTDEDLAEIERNGPVAHRGAGTFYRLKAIDSDHDAPVKEASP